MTMTKNSLFISRINIANTAIKNYCFLPEGYPVFNDLWKTNASGSVFTKILSFLPDENNARTSVIPGRLIIKFKTNSLKISFITAFYQEKEIGFHN